MSNQQPSARRMDAETTPVGDGVPTQPVAHPHRSTAKLTQEYHVASNSRRAPERDQASSGRTPVRLPSPAAVCDWTTRLLFWIAGADERHMRGRKKERYFYQLLGFSVVLTAAAAVVGMVLFLRLSVPGSWPQDIAFGLFWGLFIFWLDRWLVTRLAYGPLDATNDGSEPRSKGRYLGYAGRMLLGLLLAITISGPIVLAVFAPEINQQIIVNKNKDKSEAAGPIGVRQDFEDRRKAIKAAVDTAEKTEREKNDARGVAQTVLDDEVSGRGGTGVPGCALECREKRAVLDAAKVEAATATATATAARAKSQTDTVALEADIAAAIQKSDAGIEAGTGAFARERALFDVLFVHPILFGRWAAITGLLLLVDLMPILLKLLSSSRSSRMLHDHNARLDIADDAALAELERGTQRLKTESDHEVLRQEIREHKKLGLENASLDREVGQVLNQNSARVRKERAGYDLERDLERIELEHELRLYEIRGVHAQAMAAAAARFGSAVRGDRSRSRREGDSSQGAGEEPTPRRRVTLVNDRWILDQPLLDADRGGCGVVYIARDGRDPDSSDLFVVKLLRGYKDTVKRQRAHRHLQNEQLWAVNSLFVAPIVDAGTDTQFGPFLVTPYYHSTVARTLRKQDFTPTLEWALRITEQVLRGLVDCYNKAGVIHLDIKPANVALDEFGDVHLLDFGLARVLAVTANIPTGPPEGTRWYAPPEQLRGKDRHWPTSACDVRAVFAVLYEIVTGWPPLYREAVEQELIDPDTGAEVPERANKLWALLLNGTPVEPAVLIPKLPRVVSDLIMQGLRHEPDHRTDGPSRLDAQNALDALLTVQSKVRRWDMLYLGPLHRTSRPDTSAGQAGQVGAKPSGAERPDGRPTPPLGTGRRPVEPKSESTSIEGEGRENK